MLGATGAVGQRFVQMLQGHPWFEITALCASHRNAGKRYDDGCNWNLRGDMPEHLRDFILQECEPGIDCELVFSALPSSTAGEIEEKFAAAGYAVCSNARNHRYDPDVPLLIPEVNPEHLGLLESSEAQARLGRLHRHQSQLQHDASGRARCIRCTSVSACEGVRRHHAGHQRRRLSRRQQHGYPGQCRALHLPAKRRRWRRRSRRSCSACSTGSGCSMPIFVVSAHCNRVPVRNGHLEAVSVEFREQPSLDEMSTGAGRTTIRWRSAWAAQRTAVRPSSMTMRRIVRSRDWTAWPVLFRAWRPW